MLLIGLTGLARSGKDTAGQFLQELGYHRVGFADALKELARRVNPIIESYDDSHGMYENVDVRLQDVIEHRGPEDAKSVPEVRRFYQALGNEAREVLGPTIWLEAWRRQAEQYGRVVVTDVRYQNEADFITDLGGIVVRVNRAGAGLTGAAGSHPSETSVLEIIPRWDVDNNRRLEDLRQTVHAIAGDYENTRPWAAPEAAA